MNLSVRHARSRGFTLLELMVVLTLIAIASAMILPEMTGTYEDALLRSSGRELISVMNLASSRAVAVNQIHRVRLDREAGHYVIERCPRERGPESEYIPARELLGSDGTLDNRIAIAILRPGEEPNSEQNGEQSEASDPQESVRFYPDGTADAREIILTDRHGFRLGYRINAATGRLRPIELELK